MNVRSLLTTAFLVLLPAACADSHESDAPSGEACGPTTCAVGEVCCNASCGICTTPGEGCAAIACVDGGPVGCVDCAAPPPGCEYLGSSCESCGELVCDEVCGTRGGVTCEADEYCDFDAGCGFDDGGGVCRPRPEVCTEDCPGVCGCDGNTYCNQCIAAAMGVDTRFDLPCEMPPPADTCGGFAGANCDERQWCDFGGCPIPDDIGTCAPRPEICPDVEDPVCGCNGVTYSSSCEAAAAGMNWSHSGACER